MAQQQVVGDLADGRATAVGVPPDGEQQLMLRRGQTRRPRPAARSSGRTGAIRSATPADPRSRHLAEPSSYDNIVLRWKSRMPETSPAQTKVGRRHPRGRSPGRCRRSRPASTRGVRAFPRGFHDHPGHPASGPACHPDRRAGHRYRPGVARHDRFPDQPALLPAPQRPTGLARRQPARSPGGCGASGRRPRGGPHGAVRVGADPRPRHPRGDGTDLDQRQPRPTTPGAPQADLERGEHRLRRPLRCGGADHPDRWRGGIHHRPAFSPHGNRATGPPRCGSRSRHERCLRHPRGGSALRRRAPGLRVETALHGADRPRGRQCRRAAYGPGRRRPLRAATDLPGSRTPPRSASWCSWAQRRSGLPPG